ncbi:N-acetylmuramoyl-L-alanine amidase [Clostridium sp. LP20]|uniref:N-acetylmuramoyl-L-alanine amidase n=1 Tax=Clostridium sp. LP20 TaxID=3418665 RepID=UPI003EE58145
MKIAVDMGHTLAGSDTGAQGCGFREEIKTREIGNLLIGLLLQDGHEVLDCTIDKASSINESLASRVNKANANNVNLFVSIHLNAFNKEARGVETHVYNNCSQVSIDYALKVQKEMCKLGYVDRGVKKGNIYVVKNTNSPAILVECGFIDNAGDMALYNAEAIAKAIFTGITGNTVINKPTPAPSKASGNNWIRRLQAECNRQGFSSQVVDGYPGVNTLNSCPLIKQGANGDITRLLQEKLNSLGYNTNGIDGIFGSGTYSAVCSFQVDNRLGADGIVGRNTWNKLIYM